MALPGCTTEPQEITSLEVPVRLTPPGGRDPVVARIRRDWRALTGGRATRDPDRRTLIACSGGADSCALALALAGVRAKPVVAHIVHDMRPAPDALTDRDFVYDFSTALGLEFCASSVTVAVAPGNAEGNARAARYDALATLAAEHGCRYVATAHHADDQLETLLMRLLRGAGPRGLGGIAPARSLGQITLVRPMLGLHRYDAELLCTNAGVRWQTDATNADPTRLRAALRSSVTPELRALFSGVGAGLGDVLARTTSAQREAAELLAALARRALEPKRVEDGELVIPIDDVAADHPVLLVEIIRTATRDLIGSTRMDALTRRTLEPLLTPPPPARRLRVAGVEIVRTKGSLTLRRLDRFLPDPG